MFRTTRVLSATAVAVTMASAACGGSSPRGVSDARPTNPETAIDAARTRSEASPAELQRYVVVLSEELVPRDHSHPDNLDRCANFIRAEFESAGLPVTEQEFQVDGTTYRNVLVRVGPQTGPRIVVGAHYDAYNALPGADDNASGVAGLIELGKLLAGTHLPMGVELVAYTLEEPPYFRTENMGSAVHATSVPPSDIAVMISLEMIGYYTDQPGSQSYPDSPGFPTEVLEGMYGTVGNFAVVVGRPDDLPYLTRIDDTMSNSSDLTVHKQPAPRTVPGVDFSDHLNYWDRGVPAVMITDTAFFRNTAYHTAGDTADRLDYGRMAKVINGLHAAVVSLATEPL